MCVGKAEDPVAGVVVPRTSLRKRFELARTRDTQGQMRECVSYLENPEILVAEFCDSFLTAGLARPGMAAERIGCGSA